MPYTQNQLRCLHGMGLIPWVERHADRVTVDDALNVSTLKSTLKTDALPVNTASNEATLNNAVSGEARIAQLVEVASESTTSVPTSAPTASPAVVSTPELMQTPLVEIPFRGQRCSQLGQSDAPLLILVEAISTQQKQYPFEPADAKLFDDMLRSIAWRRQDVCLAVLPPAGASLFHDSQSTNQCDNAQAPCVADLCKPHRDAVLLFRMSVPETLDSEHLLVPLERKGMMAWQLPHPAMLRESPVRKRQAWNVLKAARARLS